MLQRDYIMRLIEEYSRVLAQIMKFRKEGRSARALDLVKENFDLMFRVPVDELGSKPPSEVLPYLEQELKLDDEHMEIVANLLKEQGDIYEEQEVWDDANQSYAQSLVVFERLRINKKEVFSLDIESKISYLKARLKEGYTGAV